MGKTTVVICIDGFDPEYLDACEAPWLRHLATKGFLKIGQCMMPSVTNVNNVSLVTASYPEVHSICSNYWFDRELGEGIYLESGESILAETIFERAKRLGKTSILATSKDKLRTLLGKGASVAVSAEHPEEWLVSAVGPPPDIYSLEVNAWIVGAASCAMIQYPADIVYITTTDYAMHAFGPEDPQSQKHVSILDEAIGALMDLHPDVTLLITADHGMSRKTRMVDLKRALGAHGITSNPVPIIKDRYVVHHSNLGGCMYVYLDSSDVSEALKVLGDIPGVEQVLVREEAAERFHLRDERIGDIVVTGEKDVVFGDPSEVEMPPYLRTHGSVHESRIPIIGYNGDFEDFSFGENRDIGRYIFERVLN